HLGMQLLKKAGWVEPVDSHFVRRSHEAGLIGLGRTNTPEIGLCPVTEPEAYGPTRSPWNPDHSPGGSSGGSAAAVAAGLVPAAHASDGGGSIRLPASMCGLVGLKPTRGRVSFGPGLGERWSGCSIQFCVTRSVRDAAGLLDVFAGREPGDPYAAPPPAVPYADAFHADPGKLRVGVLSRAPRNVETHPECSAAAQAAARLLESLGHHVEEAHPEALDDSEHAIGYVKVVAAAVARAMAVWEERLGRPAKEGELEPLTLALAESGRTLTAMDHLATLEMIHRFGRRMAAWWEGGFDLLVTPSHAQPPPRLGWVTSTPDEPMRAFQRAAPYGVFTLPYNLSGQPAISLPLHVTAGDEPGLPVGSQLVAAYGREDLLLQVAAQIEAEVPFSENRPPGVD
ncbi:MAG: amidase, partial [Myxococcota bacterium]